MQQGVNEKRASETGSDCVVVTGIVEGSSRRFAVAVAEGLDAIACLEEDGKRSRRHETHEAIESRFPDRMKVSVSRWQRTTSGAIDSPEASSRKNEDAFLLVQSLDESLVVREVKVLEAAAHEVPCSNRESRGETMRAEDKW